MSIRATAPGKLVLLGEYAVLDGAPALVMAADRRARVQVRRVDGRSRLSSAGRASAEFELDARGVRWHRADAAPRDYALIEPIIEMLMACGALDAAGVAPFHAELDTQAFFAADAGGRPVKLGLGSSAALSVAFCAALLGHAGVAMQPPAAWAERLLAAHRRFQNGAGSGLDIAASLAGGVIAYRLVEGAGRPRPSRLPGGLALACVWTGHATSTAAYVQRVRDCAEREPQRYAALRDRLGEVAARGIAAAEADRPAGLIGAIDDYGSALAGLGELAGVPIVSAEHRAIGRLAARRGVAYKPSGAGGGDVGIAAAQDRQQIELLSGDLAEAGFRAIALRVDPVGLETTVLE